MANGQQATWEIKGVVQFVTLLYIIKENFTSIYVYIFFQHSLTLKKK